MKRLLIAALVATAVAVVGGAFAADDRAGAGATRTSSTDAVSGAMTDSQLRDRLRAQGYTTVESLRREGDRISATVNKNGLTRKLLVDARTGQVEEDDDDDD